MTPDVPIPRDAVTDLIELLDAFTVVFDRSRLALEAYNPAIEALRGIVDRAYAEGAAIVDSVREEDDVMDYARSTAIELIGMLTTALEGA